MENVFLLNGSNLNNSILILEKAFKLIESDLGGIIRYSGIYKSDPWGFRSSHLFFNQCLQISTPYLPLELLEKILGIEQKLGRVRKGSGYSDREIDIDILFYGNLIMESEMLVIPHPRLHLRKFTLVPLNEIAPGYIHPGFNITVQQLLIECRDESLVTPV
jgi:2-amino-4-hydroxy-6-hydroxymethyldihydropteridine diphosphokinase